MSTINEKLIEYCMREINMASRVATILVVILFISITGLPSGVATDNEQSVTPSVSIETAGGGLFEDYINISGQSNLQASELVWAIDYIESINDIYPFSNSIMSSSTFTNVEITDDIYRWELSIPVNQLNCTCLFSISSPYYPDLLPQSIVIFVGQTSHFSVISHVPSYQYGDDSQTKYLQYDVIAPTNNEVIITENFDAYSFRANVCKYSGNSCVSESFQVSLNHSIDEAGFFVLEFNQTNLNVDDGIYQFEVFLRDSFLRYSNIDYKILTFDTNPPVVDIRGALEVEEMSTHVYSANVDDGYDSSLIAVTWTISEPNGIVRGVGNAEYVSDTSISVQFNESGIWDITVLAIDSVGYFTTEIHRVEVINIPPVISLQTSFSEAHGYEGTYQVSNDESWFFDASYSTDTNNDVDELTFSWLLDGEIIHVGKNLTKDQLNISGHHKVVLLVSDDDGDYTELELNIEIASQNQHDEHTINYILLSSVILIIILSTVLIFRSRGENNSFNLPKWGK